MIQNKHSAGDPFPGKARSLRSGENAGGAFCFALLGLLHIALIMAADFPERTRIPDSPRSRVMVFDFLPPEPAPQAFAPAQAFAAAPAPALPPEPRAPLPAAEASPAEALSAEGPVAETPAAEMPAGEPAGASAFGGSGGAAPDGRRPGMSEAEYTALIMRRLEEKKIYPLSMRKRGIAGDAEAFFAIRPDGSLGSLRAGDGPAHPFLVQAALETVRSAAPFPVMEGRGEDYFFRVTIKFQLE